MPNVIKANIDTAFTADSTLNGALSSLASGSRAAGAVISNHINLALLCEYSIQLGSINPSGAPYLEVHLCRLLGDGSTYEDIVASNVVANMAITTGASAKNGAVQFEIPPGTFNVVVVNHTGVTLASGGNSIHYRLSGYTVNG